MKRVLELRALGHPLGQIAQTIIDECLALENTRKHCYDNVTLVIVSLSDYLRDYESQLRESYFASQQFALRKMESESSLQSADELADGSASAQSERHSLMSGSVHAFFGISEPSS